MDFNGLKGLFRWIGGVKNPEMTVERIDGFWYIMDSGKKYAGPYKTEGAAKGQRTRLLAGYTPASRRPVEGE